MSFELPVFARNMAVPVSAIAALLIIIYAKSEMSEVISLDSRISKCQASAISELVSLDIKSTKFNSVSFKAHKYIKNRVSYVAGKCFGRPLRHYSNAYYADDGRMLHMAVSGDSIYVCLKSISYKKSEREYAIAISKINSMRRRIESCPKRSGQHDKKSE